MFDRSKFTAAMKRQNLKQEDVSLTLSINESTLYRKMTGESDFTRAEIQTLRNLLSLNVGDAEAIFFADEPA